MDPVGAIIVSEYFPFVKGFDLLFISLGKEIYVRLGEIPIIRL